MLAVLAEEAPLMMLFLKSVERIEILDWQPDAAAPVLVFECCVQVGVEQVAKFKNPVLFAG